MQSLVLCKIISFNKYLFETNLMDEFLVISKNCLQTQGYLALHEKFPYSEFSGPYFSAFGLNTERWRDTQCVSVVSPNVGKYGPGKLRIRTLFT